MDFPNIQPPSWPLKEDTEDNIIRSPFEAGYVHRRRRYTKKRKSWTLTWPLMSQADKDALDAFLEAGGDVDYFNWTHPKTGAVHVVEMTKPPDTDYVGLDRWKVAISLREV